MIGTPLHNVNGSKQNVMAKIPLQMSSVPVQLSSMSQGPVANLHFVPLGSNLQVTLLQQLLWNGYSQSSPSSNFPSPHLISAKI